MSLTVPVPLSAEEVAALESQAKAQGISVDALLRKAVLETISGTPERPPLTAAELDQAFEEIADLVPEGTPVLSDEAMRRESIYTREDEWDRKSA